MIYRIGALALLTGITALTAGAQDGIKEYVCEVSSFDARIQSGSVAAKLQLKSDLLDGSIVVVNARLVRHRLEIRLEDKLIPNQVDMIVGTVKSQISGGKSSGAVLFELGTPGVYQFDLFFDPQNQQNTELLKRKMGKRNFFRRDFPPFRVIVGEPQKLLQTIFRDAEECAGHLDKCRKLFDRLEKEGGDPEGTLKVLNDINKEKQKCSEEMAGSLLNATYEFIVAILDDLDRARQYIQQLLKDREEAKKKSASSGGGGGGGGSGGGSGGGGGDQDDTHKDAGPADTALSSSADGGRLKLEKLDKFIDRADVVRLRETLSWISQFTRLSMSKLDDAYLAVGRGEKADVFTKVKNASDDCVTEITRGLKVLKAGHGSGDKLKARQEAYEQLQVIEKDQIMDDKAKGLAARLSRYGADLEKLAGEGAPAPKDDVKNAAKDLKVFMDAIEKKMMGGPKE